MIVSLDGGIMDGLVGSYLLSKEVDGDHTWDWTDSDDWEEGLDAIRAVHFHTDEVSAAELTSLLQLPNLEAIAFCEDHVHSEASLTRIASLVDQRGVADLEFEKEQHLPWLARFPRTKTLRIHSICDLSEESSWAPITAATELEALFLASVDIDDAGLKRLAGLTKLKCLVLDGNDELNDLSPLAELTALEQLSLSGTEVTGVGDLSGLASLRRLDLSHTEVKELAPLAGLTALEELDLRELKVTDDELKHLRGLTALKRLNLCGCPIGDAGLRHLSGLSLDELALSGTRVSPEKLRELCPQGWKGMFDEDAQVAVQRAGKPDPDGDDDWAWMPVTSWAGDPAELKAVRLRDTYLPNPGGFDWLVFTTGLEHLDVANMTLTLRDLERIGDLRGLKELSLAGVDLEDPAHEDEEDYEAPELDDARVAALLERLPHLTMLDLTGASLTDATPLTKLGGLRQLGLGQVPIAPLAQALGALALDVVSLNQGGINDETLDHLAGLKLRDAVLARNPFTSAGLARLDLSTLRGMLVLEGTQVGSLEPLRGCDRLRNLDLQGTKIDDGAADVLATLTGLESLVLADTEVGDAAAGAAAKLPRLEKLSLRKTRISDAAVPLLCASERLKQVNLQAVWLSDASKEALEASPIQFEYSAPDDEDEPRPPFAGLEQARFTGALPAEVAGRAWRLSVPSYDAEFPLEVFTRKLLDDPRVGEIEALVIGSWEEPYDGPPTRSLELLVEHASKLPKLRALYVADMDSDECEVSWIQHGDLSALVSAFPGLEELKIRGSLGLSFSQPLSLPRLKRFTIECGGLPSGVLQSIASAVFPALEELELYLGTGEYGWEEEGLAHLTPILSGKLFPKLRRLGLRDSEAADAVAALVATAPVVEQLEALDLSLGTLGDAGAEALLAGPAIARLKTLDLHHHYMSEAVMNRIEGLGPEVDVSRRQEPDDWGDGELHRYVALGE